MLFGNDESSILVLRNEEYMIILILLVHENDGRRLKDILFVGEGDHSCTIAAARLAHFSKASQARWVSTELIWPELDSEVRVATDRNVARLRDNGIVCCDGVDACNIRETLSRNMDVHARTDDLFFDLVLWMMPYPPRISPKRMQSISKQMNSDICNFVKSARIRWSRKNVGRIS